jgi:hypothetical protein
VIAVFRNKSREPAANIQLPLIPGEKHRLRSIISDKDLGIFANSDWVRGIPIRFPDGQAVEVLEVIPLIG